MAAVEAGVGSFEQQVGELRALVSVVASRLEPATLEADLARAGRLHRELCDLHRQLELELEGAPESAQLRARAADANEDLRDCGVELRRLQRPAARATRAPDAARDALVKEGDATQDATAEALERIKKILGEGDRTGAEAAARLRAQKDELDAAGQDMDHVHDNLGKARRVVATLLKNSARDRCTQIVCLVNVIFGLLAIVLICL